MPSKKSSYLESDLSFKFAPEQWVVEQYDRHPFYEALKSRGLKGVDFIGIHHWEEVVLFEVKNYRIRHHRQDIRHLLEHPDRFVSHIQRKFEDTLRAIRVIRDYYERKWWYRLMDRWMGARSSLGNWVPEWLFWRRAFQLTEGISSYRLVLWLELDDAYKGIGPDKIAEFIRDAEGRLKKAFGGNGRFLTASCSSPVFPKSIEVKIEDIGLSNNGL